MRGVVAESMLTLNPGRTPCPPGLSEEKVMRTVLLAALLLLAPMGAMAAEEANSLQVLVDQQTALRAELTRGPKDLTPRQVGIVRKAQDEFFRLVEGKTSLDQLAIDEKVRVENALEKINAELVNTNAARANQDVCWREQMTGSKMQVTRCGTQQEIDQAREGARGFMDKPKICVPPGCGA
ncbi:MAG: hypothetical protein ACREPE_09470 [Lysobacter sp.]